MPGMYLCVIEQAVIGKCPLVYLNFDVLMTAKQL